MAKITDSIGFEIFARGHVGAAHVHAHRMLDAGTPEPGHRALEELFRRHPEGEGSEWVHVQWHMMIFELLLARPREALARFQAHVLPSVEGGEHALQDGPSGLWHLRLSLGDDAALPWEPAWETAVRALWRSHATGEHPPPFVLLHHLLAIAGAGDLPVLDSWLSNPANRPQDARAQTLHDIAGGVRAFVAGDYATAANTLAESVQRVDGMGGSHAQGLVFRRLQAEAATRAAWNATPLSAGRGAPRALVGWVAA